MTSDSVSICNVDCTDICLRVFSAIISQKKHTDNAPAITYTRRKRRGLSVELPVYPREAVGVKSPLPFTVPDFRAR